MEVREQYVLCLLFIILIYALCYSPLSALGPSWKRDAASQGATLNRLKFIFVQRAGLTQHGEQRRGVVLVKAGLSHARVHALVPQVDVHDLQHSIRRHVPACKSERNVWEERVVKKNKTSQHSKSTATSIGNILNKSGILMCFFFLLFLLFGEKRCRFSDKLERNCFVICPPRWSG